MESPFNAEEILEIACEIERNGERYYNRAAELMESEESATLFKELAAMEADHLHDFTSMKSDLATATIGYPDEPAVLYLRALAEGYVFPRGANPADQLSTDTSLEDILRVAIGLEKDSIMLYLGLRDVVPEDMGKDRVDAIINEEKGHVVKLSTKLDEIK